ncbi:Glycosyl transferase, group 1 [Labilithrix luteola]|uniref:Glycosyl transferase, group 1 n=1 Tax=Labilithrix luteola TaxID=1391654 RepID=A0A0K1PY56_9BACT|nr:Glycosyl transferase, group 1 [Labilithrix luteola]
MTRSGTGSLRVLVITKIFPNAAEPASAPFNRQQIGALARRCQVDVLGTIPWHPGAGLLAGRTSAGRLTKVPDREVIDGMDVRHPRTLFVPRIGHGLWAPLYFASLAPLVLSYRGKVDVLLGTWAYPDGAAAVALSRLLGVPAVVKLHGSDMNMIAKLPGPRRLLRLALPQAAHVVAVSRALAEEACALGVPADRVSVVMNGVDAELFHLRDRGAARRELGLAESARIVLFVGNLKESKGVLDLAAAFERIAGAHPSIHLAIVGGGEAKAALVALAARWPGRVMLAGARPLREVPIWMAACDVLSLPSWAEGTPNVVLEALASGRRVIASAVGGIPDLITAPALGEVVAARDVDALAAALGRAAMLDYDPAAVAALGARGSWADSAERLLDVLDRAKGPATRAAL